MTEREGGKSRSPLLFILVIFLLTPLSTSIAT
jgi:hypothetical protein